MGLDPLSGTLFWGINSSAVNAVKILRELIPRTCWQGGFEVVLVVLPSVADYPFSSVVCSYFTNLNRSIGSVPLDPNPVGQAFSIPTAVDFVRSN